MQFLRSLSPSLVQILFFHLCVLIRVILDAFSNDLDTTIDEALAQVGPWFMPKCVVYLYVLIDFFLLIWP